MNTSISVIEINATAESVWDALVNPAKVKLWQYGSDVVTTWEVGSPIRYITKFGDAVFEQWGTVLEFTPCKSLKYSLFFPRHDLIDSPENYFFMTYLLEKNANKIKLSIIQEDPRPKIKEALENKSDKDGDNPILVGLKKLIEES